MIETANLRLVPCELAHFEAYLSDRQELGNLLGVKIPDGWPHFPEALPRGYKRLKCDPALLGWWTYLFVHPSEQILIGSGGFKGRVNEEGMVEIGYEIAPSYRERGFATEAARGLIDYAFSHALVRMVDAHTMPERNASARVLSKVGMSWMGAVLDPDHGDIWHWRLRRAEYEAARKSKRA